MAAIVGQLFAETPIALASADVDIRAGQAFAEVPVLPASADVDTRVGQAFGEAATVGASADISARVGQFYIEVAVPNATIRVGQLYAEAAAVGLPADIDARVGQAFVEVAVFSVIPPTDARVGQFYVEIALSPPPPVQPPDGLPPNERLTKPMPLPTADRVGTHKHRRFFVQPGGPLPTDPVLYAGVESQYMIITGVSNPQSGGVDPIYVRDPYRWSSYQAVGNSISPPPLPAFDVTLLESHGAIPFQLMSQPCPYNYYELVGACKDLSDFLGGWTDYVHVYSQALLTNKDYGDRSSFDSDDQIEDTLSYVPAAIYPVGSLAFGEKAATDIDREVVDVVYGSDPTCPDCGPADDGTRRIYAITESSGSGSPGLPAEVIYTTDGGQTWSEVSPTGIGATEDPIAIDVVGDKLIVLSRTAASATTGGYYYATINRATGVPGTWTKVTTGFVANFQPNDIYVAGPREVFICADGGYIYRTDNIAVGVEVIDDGSTTSENLLRIHGQDETIVSTGENSSIVISVNRGRTFANAVGSIAAALDVTAVQVMDKQVIWVGTASSAAHLYYTTNGGETWVEQTFPGTGTGNIYDIVAATDEVIYYSYSDGTPTARLYRTWNGGYSWTAASPAMLNVPTFDRATRLAVPFKASVDVAANNLAVGGLAANGVDGILLLGIAPIL